MDELVVPRVRARGERIRVIAVPFMALSYIALVALDGGDWFLRVFAFVWIVLAVDAIYEFRAGGRPLFTLDSERITIARVSPILSRRRSVEWHEIQQLVARNGYVTLVLANGRKRRLLAGFGSLPVSELVGEIRRRLPPKEPEVPLVGSNITWGFPRDADQGGQEWSFPMGDLVVRRKKFWGDWLIPVGFPLWLAFAIFLIVQGDGGSVGDGASPLVLMPVAIWTFSMSLEGFHRRDRPQMTIDAHGVTVQFDTPAKGRSISWNEAHHIATSQLGPGHAWLVSTSGEGFSLPIHGGDVSGDVILEEIQKRLDHVRSKSSATPSR